MLIASELGIPFRKLQQLLADNPDQFVERVANGDGWTVAGRLSATD